MDWTTVAVAALAATVTTGTLAALLPRWGVIDVPNHRSSHTRPIPRGGGLGVVVGSGLALVVAPHAELLAIGLIGALALAVVGFVDDIRSLPAVHRLALQLCVSATAATMFLRDRELGLPVAIVAAGAATLWLSGFVNLFNFMDGSNGLAGFNALIAGACFSWVGAEEGVATLLVGGSVLLGSAAGFLPWNFPVPRIFLGDVGSYAIGFVIAWLALVGVVTTDLPLWSLAPCLLVLVDTTLTLVRRARRGESLMAAHREHVYQRLTRAPGSPLPAVVAGVASVAFVAASALPIVGWVLVAWILIAVVYVASPALVRRGASSRPEPG